MSQEGKRESPRMRGKSPSRIPVFNAGASSARKRTANVLVDLTGDDDDNTNAKVKPPASTPLSGLHRLKELARADVRNRNISPRQIAASKSGVPWVEKHLPRSLDDLFVHKKKVEEIMCWMNNAFTGKLKGKICVVNGPAGCGKTATVYLVANKLEADIKEWTNPMNLTEFKRFGTEDFRDEVQGRSQLDLMTDFLFRTSQYRSLPIKGKGVKKNRLIVIEDIPNMFYRDTQVFHDLLRKYSTCGQTPLVFIFTDSAASDHSMYKMFPGPLLKELCIENISMNPVANTLMVKFLLEICKRESVPVDRSQVEQIAATTNGDLRCAVNNLQFSLTKEKFSTHTTFRKPANKKSRAQNAGSSNTDHQQKDETIQLFRALGKVLYAKRDETNISEVETKLVGDMEKERRIHPLLENPESICNKMEVSADTFLKFIHQNYATFFSSMDDLRNAAEYLSDSDFILSGWKFDDSGCKQYKVREAKEQVAMSITNRGLMHANAHRRPVGFKPLVKPIVSNLEQTVRESVESTRQALFHLRELQTSLFTEAIPFYAKLIRIKPSSYQVGQLSVGTKEIIERGLFQHKSAQIGRRLLLDEKEVVEESNETTVESETVDVRDKVENSQSGGNRQATDLETSVSADTDNIDDEEFVIEDFE